MLLGLAEFQTFTYRQPTKYSCFWFYLAFKGLRFSEKDWYYLQAQTHLKFVVWIFPRFLQLSINLETEKQNAISKLKFKISVLAYFLSPIKFSEKKWPLGLAVFQTFTYRQPTKYSCFWFYLAFKASRILNVHLQTAYQIQCRESIHIQIWSLKVKKVSLISKFQNMFLWKKRTHESNWRKQNS